MQSLVGRAYQLSEGVSEREKFYIDSYYFDLVTGDLDNARKVYEQWAQVYPREDKPVGNLGLLFGYLGQYENGLVKTREALLLHPESSLRYGNPTPAVDAPAPSAGPADDKAAPQDRLRGVEDTIRASDEQRRKIEADIESLRADRARLNAALIDTTAKVQDAERQIAAANHRLDGLNANADALTRSLDNRRAVIADVLAVLQRMGRDPPPAILVRPQDMAEAIRAATLLEFDGRSAEERDRRACAPTSLNSPTCAPRSPSSATTLRERSAALAADKMRLAALIEARQQSLDRGRAGARRPTRPRRRARRARRQISKI